MLNKTPAHNTTFVGLLMRNRLYQMQVCQEGTWRPHGTLAVGESQALLNGKPLASAKLLAGTNSLAVGRPGVAGYSGRLYFSEDARTFFGFVGLPDGTSCFAAGDQLTSTYATERALAGSGNFSGWSDFSYSTQWAGTGSDRHHAVHFGLGDADISDRTTVTSLDAGVTTIEMLAETVLMGARDHFTIKLDIDGVTFMGTYTDADGTAYDWRGREKPASAAQRIAMPAMFAAPAVNLTIDPAPGGDSGLTIEQLLSVSSIFATTVKGDIKIIDQAQTRAGQYFQNNLVNALAEPWQGKFFGGPVSVPPAVDAIRLRHSEFYSGAATLNMGQMLAMAFKTDPKEGPVVARIDNDKMSQAWKSFGTNKEYGLQSSELYVQAYADAVTDIQPFLTNNPAGWATQLHAKLTSDEWLSHFSLLIASGTYKHVRQQMYEWYVQMLVLNPQGQSDAQDVLSHLFAVVMGQQFSQLTWDSALQPYLVQIIDNMLHGDSTDMYNDKLRQAELAAMRDELNVLATAYGNSTKLADDIFLALEAAAARARKAGGNNPAAVADGAYQQLADGERGSFWQRFKAGQGPKILGAIAYGAAAAFFIYELVSGGGSKQTPAQVLLELNLGLLALGALIKGIEHLMATRLGPWLTELADTGVSRLTRAIGTLGKWFTKEGVNITNPVVKAIFTESAEKFMSQRLAPAMALFAIAMSAYSLANDVMNGDVQNIVFDSLNIVMGVLDVIAIGLEMFSVACGPFGLIVAAVGFLIGFIQFLVDLFHPPPPPPDPIEQFVDGPLAAAGFTKAAA